MKRKTWCNRVVVCSLFLAVMVNPMVAESRVGGTWSHTGGLNQPRWHHTATLLPDGRVLVAAGYDHEAGGCLAGAEVYSPPVPIYLPCVFRRCL